MKTVKTNFRFLLMAVMAIGVISCDGEDGMDGAIGPQGPQGEVGPAGANGMDGADGMNGMDGADGEDGNANVIASEWIAADFPDAFSFSQSIFEIEDSNITQETVDAATVLAYFSFENVDDGPIEQVFALPFTEPLFRTVFFEYDYEVGIIRFRQFDDINDTFDPDPFDGSVRYVIIPANSTSARGGATSVQETLKQEGVDTSDYYAVMDHFGLEY